MNPNSNSSLPVSVSRERGLQVCAAVCEAQPCVKLRSGAQCAQVTGRVIFARKQWLETSGVCSLVLGGNRKATGKLFGYRGSEAMIR